MVVKNDIALGIDIGGTKISMACVSGGEIIGEVLSYKTPCVATEILNQILEGIEVLIAKEFDIKAIGIATAGAVNKENTRVVGSTGNLPKGYSDINFKEEIENRFGIKTLVENDANAAAYAEFKVGAAIGHMNTITVTLGTGVGGGIIVDGKLLRGKSGAGAEVGHIPLTWKKKRPCTCGDWDCWEAYASGTGYAITAREMAAKIPSEQRTGILKDRDVSKLTTHDLILGFKYGDEFALKIHEAWIEFVLMGLISLTNVFDPDSIILSGGMAKFIDFEDLNKRLDARCHISKTKIIHAKAENNAGILGGAMLALKKFL
jgi:glucokinase